jgi:hypothetical protein
MPRISDESSNHTTLQAVKAALLPFLRSVALFKSCIGISSSATNFACDADEITATLHVPSIETTVNVLQSILQCTTEPADISVLQLSALSLSQWAKTLYSRDSKDLMLVSNPSVVFMPRFVTLPTSFVDLMSMGSSAWCSRGKMACQRPALCLSCGAVLCSLSTCCQFDISEQRREATSVLIKDTRNAFDVQLDSGAISHETGTLGACNDHAIT